MDMRDFLILVEGYLTTLSEESVPEVITEAQEAAPLAMSGFYISATGDTMDAKTLIESEDPSLRCVLVETENAEFHATWEETPTVEALRTLSALIETRDEFEAYYVGSMIYPLRQQASRAVASLLREAERGY